MLKKVVISGMLIASLSLQAMESSSSTSSSSSSSAVVTLISDDGKKFVISREAAEYSKMLSAALRSGCQEGQMGVITLHTISGDLLAPMAAILKYLPYTLNIDNFVINKLAAYDTQSLVAFAHLAGYLELFNLEQSIIRLLIFNELKENKTMDINEIKQKIAYECMQQNLTAQIAQINGLVNENFGYITSSAGFKALGETIDQRGNLKLNNKNITNTYGLGLLDNRNEILHLWLYLNQLKYLPSEAFDGLTKLEGLYLWNNELEELSTGAFDGVVGLEILTLEGNKLKELPAEIFNWLPMLQQLSLHSNQLKNLPDDIFNKQTELKDLNLGNNQLNSLPVGIFNEQTKLQDLSLRGNKLKSLPTGVLSKLANLEDLNLDDNQLRSLPLAVFNGLTKLQKLKILESNNLGMTEAQIRELLDPAIRDRVSIATL